MIDSVINLDAECSSYIDSDEKGEIVLSPPVKREIVLSPPVKRPEAETDCDSDGLDDKMRDFLIICLVTCW